MDKSKFVLLTATIDDDQWTKIGPSFSKYQKKYPDGIVCIAGGIWIIDRTKAEIALTDLTKHLHRIQVPLVVTTLSSSPTIAAKESELQQVGELGLDFYPMPFAE